MIDGGDVDIPRLTSVSGGDGLKEALPGPVGEYETARNQATIRICTLNEGPSSTYFITQALRLRRIISGLPVDVRSPARF